MCVFVSDFFMGYFVRSLVLPVFSYLFIAISLSL